MIDSLKGFYAVANLISNPGLKTFTGFKVRKGWDRCLQNKVVCSNCARSKHFHPSFFLQDNLSSSSRSRCKQSIAYVMVSKTLLQVQHFEFVTFNVTNEGHSSPTLCLNLYSFTTICFTFRVCDFECLKCILRTFYFEAVHFTFDVIYVTNTATAAINHILLRLMLYNLLR